jgi:hypothetical protein
VNRLLLAALTVAAFVVVLAVVWFWILPAVPDVVSWLPCGLGLVPPGMLGSHFWIRRRALRARGLER